MALLFRPTTSTYRSCHIS